MFTYTQIWRVILQFKNIYFNTEFQLSDKTVLKLLGRWRFFFFYFVCLLFKLKLCHTVFCVSEMGIVIALF